MNTSSFTQQLVNTQREIFRYALKLTADREDANDLLQETSLKVLVNEDKFTPGTNFNAWVYTIMRNIFINNYRKNACEIYVGDSFDLYCLSKTQRTGFEVTEGAYDLKEIHRIVNSLPKEYRIPFTMYVSGFKYCEIAEKMNLPVGTIKSRIFYARLRMKKDLRDFQRA